MTENFSTSEPDLQQMFAEGQPFPLEVIDLWAEGSTPLEVLKVYNKNRGLALDQAEVILQFTISHNFSPRNFANQV